MSRIAESQKLPQSITVGMGTKFQLQVLDIWVCQAHFNPLFIRPGMPSDATSIESFNGKFRDEGLNELVSSRWHTRDRSSGGDNDTTPKNNPVLIRMRQNAGHGSATPIDIRLLGYTARLAFVMRETGLSLESVH